MAARITEPLAQIRGGMGTPVDGNDAISPTAIRLIVDRDCSRCLHDSTVRSGGRWETEINRQSHTETPIVAGSILWAVGARRVDPGTSGRSPLSLRRQAWNLPIRRIDNQRRSLRPDP